jgi:hypothetical protein
MSDIIKNKSISSNNDDCNCGKPIKITDPRRKKLRIVRKIRIKKKI